MTLAELRDLADRLIEEDPTAAHCQVLLVEVGYDAYQELTGDTERQNEDGEPDPAGDAVVLDTREP
ncbi:hypothetical protein J4H86_21245 [Spiractinospora alimapuensis]|uniref:hypothetical protein n=1 Tax=Spiractinospora alimapuensis TaxID=2820884 RepID=UPI001F2B2697|nr:hypothetical protein [Spiractinospora alimapuensis]QVQ51317.1 hypothetical protein J4H86_21245 [Spiractinospora alimapuensis]